MLSPIAATLTPTLSSTVSLIGVPGLATCWPAVTVPPSFAEQHARQVRVLVQGAVAHGRVVMKILAFCPARVPTATQ